MRPVQTNTRVESQLTNIKTPKKNQLPPENGALEEKKNKLSEELT